MTVVIVVSAAQRKNAMALLGSVITSVDNDVMHVSRDRLHAAIDGVLFPGSLESLRDNNNS